MYIIPTSEIAKSDNLIIQIRRIKLLLKRRKNSFRRHIGKIGKIHKVLSSAKSLLVDYEKLKQAHENHNVVEAEGTLKEAYETDVREILREVRKEKILPENTIK